MLVGSPWNQNLGIIGFPNCTAFVNSIITFSATVDAQGFASLTVTVPNNAALLGAVVDTQWVVLEAASLAASNAAVLRVGT